jgi:transcriptional antiterminator NusG
MIESQPPNQRWEIILTRQAEKTLRRLSKLLLRSIDQAIMSLSQNPRPPESEKLVGPYDNLYRLWVDEWRIAYAVEDDQQVVLILEIAPKQQPERYQLDEVVDTDPISEEKSMKSMEEKLARADYGALEKILARLTEVEPRDLLSLVEAESIDAVKSKFLFLNLIRQAGQQQIQPGRTAQEAEGDKSQSQSKSWYVIYCHSGYEPKVKQSLIHRIEALGMQDKIFQVAIPGETEEKSEDESHHPIPRQTSPGAILVEMILDDDSWYVVKNTPGVSAFFGSGGKPTPLRSDEVDKIIQYLGGEPERLEFVEEPIPERIRLLITGDNSETLIELYQLLTVEPGIEIVGIVPNSDEGFQTAIEREPDIVLKELSLPAIKFQQFPATDVPLTQIAVQDGIDYIATPPWGAAREFVTQPVSREALMSTIRRVYRSKTDKVGAERWPAKAAAWWFEQGKLGQYVEITLSVANLAESLPFYEKLGLKQVDGHELPYPWATLSDGLLHLGLHQQPFSSPALTYFSSFPLRGRTGVSFRVVLLQMLGVALDPLEQIGTKSMLLRKNSAYPVATSFKAADGQPVILADMPPPFKKSRAEDFSIPVRKFLSACQAFGEFSLSAADVAASVAYWQRLGFKRLAGDNKPYPWAIVSDGRVRLGLHQTPRFTKPTLSYFAPDMPERLERLRQQDIPFISEHKNPQGQVIGALIRSPDQQPIFLFTGKTET